MKKYVIDTHALIWFLDGDKRLSKSAAKALTETDCSIIIPSIVLTETKFLLLKKISSIVFTKILEFIENDSRCIVYPLDLNVIDLLPTNLDIHDSIITATALLFNKTSPGKVKLITKDSKITDSDLIPVLW